MNIKILTTIIQRAFLCDRFVFASLLVGNGFPNFLCKMWSTYSFTASVFKARPFAPFTNILIKYWYML